MLLQIFAGPGVDHGLAHVRQKRFRTRERLRRPADHEGQRARIRRRNPARHRRIDRGKALRRGGFGDALGSGDVDRRTVDQDRGRVRVAEQAFGIDLLDVLARGEHRDDRFCAIRRLRR
jgi:hypothetical protein